jgi:DAK2 domain fusion protein YloV
MERQGGCTPVAAALEHAVARLASVREAIDRLNVFPVPDGDTGSNMLRTLEGTVRGLEGAPTDPRACGAHLARAALLAARGNSGVILAQILGSLLRALVAEEELAAAWMRGLAEAAVAARQAVLDPKPGTMLSVIEAAAAAPDPASALSAAAEAEARTPTQLAVLAQAGVVDSGGAGLVVVLEAMSEALGLAEAPCDHPWLASTPVVSPAVPDLSEAALEARTTATSARFEVMFSLEAPASHVEALRSVWAGIGDSIVVVGDGTVWRCHVHTSDLATAIQAGIDAGRVRDLAITDLEEQVEEAAWVQRAEPAPAALPRETAVVAVGLGEGIVRLFRSFGVAAVVAGGQGANPSIGELVEAIEHAGAKRVLVLPNNANILATAKAAVGLTDVEVVVVPTVHLVQGFAALMAYDPESPLDENERRMSEAARRVRWGEVTMAVREGRYAQGAFDAGSYIGIADSGIVSVGATPEDALVGLVRALVDDESEILTVFVGEQGSGERLASVLEQLRAELSDLEVEQLEGGQPVYPYLLGVE